MSERMIELQRAKLGLPPTVGPTNAISALQSSTAATAATAVSVAASTFAVPTAAVATPLTPHQTAAVAVYTQEEKLQKFLDKLKKRQDDHTVPTALTRRMLHRQGVGYLDENVASVVSACADRFLATVMQQAVACRNQRLKGAELAKQAARHRRRHVLQHEADADDRKRRKTEQNEAKKKSNLAAVAAADTLKAKGLTPASMTGGGVVAISPSKSKKKKQPSDVENGDKPNRDDGYDSLEEEEQYYQNYYGDHRDAIGDESDTDEEDEKQFMLLLRDLERPLEAWNVHLTGKVGLGAVADDSPDEESGDEGVVAERADENGNADEKKKAAGDEKEDSQSTPSASGRMSPKGTNSPANEKANAKSPLPTNASQKDSSPLSVQPMDTSK